MRDHRKLQVFHIANDLVLETYRQTQHFPREEVYGLTSQMRRCAVSVAANIVEGCARQTHKEYVNFLNIAFGSLRELGYYIDLSQQLNYLTESGHQQMFARYEHCAKVLSGLIKSLQAKSDP